ncbi:MAG: peptidase [Ramlibacter sp.]|nr:peptidase [Ramlibacter sp.]
MPSVNAASYSRVDDYFYSLLTRQLDATGQYKDRFSFIASTQDADSLLTGNNIGYGVRWETDAQGRLRVAFVDAGSPALSAGLARGGELVELQTPGASWFPNAPATISFVYRTAPAAATRTVTLASAAMQEDPLPLVQTLTSPAGRKVAYLLFNAHTTGAQDRLIPAIQAAQAAGVQDVVLDLRYNGGGYLYTALTLSSMLAGSTADGQVFEQLRFNDKRAAETDASALRFSGSLQVAETSFPEGTPLPRLALPRVFVLAGAGTCSASESVVNSLRGVGIEVVIIGPTISSMRWARLPSDCCRPRWCTPTRAPARPRVLPRRCPRPYSRRSCNSSRCCEARCSPPRAADPRTPWPCDPFPRCRPMWPRPSTRSSPTSTTPSPPGAA